MTHREPFFPSHEYLTVKELAELLRLKERKVYDLAANGKVPCSRATGKLLFPAIEIRRWLESAQSGATSETESKLEQRPDVVLGSHDPLLDWAIRQSRCGLASYCDGSHDGLHRFAAAEGVVAGLHVYDSGAETWNVPMVSRYAENLDAALIHFSVRSRGIVFRSGSDLPRSVTDLAGKRIVPRQPESGTETLFRQLAFAAGLNLSSMNFADIARTEDEAVEAVSRAEADVTFGLESVARAYGLEFSPVINEHFALLIDRKAWFEPPLQRLAAFCQSDKFVARAHSYGGYDISGFGAVLWNA
ncbi:MAG: substrate-binding domain-containing protein [Granulosicoccus sp.]